MQPIIKQALLVAGMLVIALPVYARDGGGGCGLRDRIGRMEWRIDRGIESGSLTRGEVRRLEQERREIRNLYRDLRDDDMLDGRGCRILEKRIDSLSRHISELKHNYRTEEDNATDPSDYTGGSHRRYGR